VSDPSHHHQERFNRDKREADEQHRRQLEAGGQQRAHTVGRFLQQEAHKFHEVGSLFDELAESTVGAVAKRNDPDTSHEAARSMTKEKLTDLKLNVLNIVCKNGPISQEGAHELYVQHHGPAAYSSVRTRFNELERLGYLKLVDREGKTVGGRACNRYIGSQTPCWAPEDDQPHHARLGYEGAYKALRDGVTGIVLDEHNSLRASLRHHLADLVFQTDPARSDG
jgi:hypothetical protein